MGLEFGSRSSSDTFVNTRNYEFGFTKPQTRPLVVRLCAAMRRVEIRLQAAEKARQKGLRVRSAK